jgi:hypothetical protein
MIVYPRGLLLRCQGTEHLGATQIATSVVAFEDVDSTMNSTDLENEMKLRIL